MSQDVEYSLFHDRFVDTTLTPALLDESAAFLTAQSDEWMNGLQISLEKVHTASALTPKLCLNTFLVLNKLFPLLSNRMSWTQTIFALLSHAVQILADAKKEIAVLRKLVQGWQEKALFAEQAEPWVTLVGVKPTKTKRARTEIDGEKETDRGTSGAKNELPPIVTEKETEEKTENGKEKEKEKEKSADPQFLVLTTPLCLSHNAHVSERDALLLVIHMCSYYLQRERERETKVYWRLLLLSATALMHMHATTFVEGEDRVAVACAAVFLAGKVEQMFLKHSRILELARTLSPQLEFELPDEDKLICYEAELLQLIHYNTNSIPNAIRPLQKLTFSLNVLSEEDFYCAVELLSTEAFLCHAKCFSYSQNVVAITVALLVIYRESAADEKCTALCESEVFEKLRDNENIILVLELLSVLVSDVSQMLPCGADDVEALHIRIATGFLESNALSPSEIDESLLPLSLRR